MPFHNHFSCDGKYSKVIPLEEQTKKRLADKLSISLFWFEAVLYDPDPLLVWGLVIKQFNEAEK